MPVRPDPEPSASMIAMTPDQFELLMSRLTTVQASGGGSPELATAIAAIGDMARAQIAATSELGAQVKRTVIRTNADHEHISVFNYLATCEYCQTRTRHPEGDQIDSGKMGHPKPPLRRETFWPKGVDVKADELTVFEIELFNKFETNKTARNGRWTATISQDGKQIQVHAPSYFADERADLPNNLSQILLELLYGADVVDPELTSTTILKLQRQIDDLTAQVASNHGKASDAASAAS